MAAIESIFPLLLKDTGDADGSLDLSPQAVALSALVLLLTQGISFHLELGLHWQFLVAAVRMVLQLSALGLVLVPIFSSEKLWLVLTYA
eukprot:gene10509-8477_t